MFNKHTDTHLFLVCQERLMPGTKSVGAPVIRGNKIDERSVCRGRREAKMGTAL